MRSGPGCDRALATTPRCASSSSPAPGPAFCAGADLKGGGAAVTQGGGGRNPFVAILKAHVGRAEAGDRGGERHTPSAAGSG